MKMIMRKVACILAAVAIMLNIISWEAEAASVKYTNYTSKRFTYSVNYPTKFTSRSDYGSEDGTKLKSSDGKAQMTIWNSYGKSSKRNGKTVVETAQKNRKITVVKATAKEGSYTYTSGKNIVQYYYYFLSNGEIAFQISYPKGQKAYYSAAVKGIISSVKANKALTLKD